MEQHVIERIAPPSAQAAFDTSAAAPRVTSAVPRFDIYSSIHKGVRASINATLGAVGAMDAADGDEVQAVLGQTRELLDFLQGHLEHENAFIHPAMQARRPESAVGTADDHVEHEHAIADLRLRVDAVERAAGNERHAAAQRLYRRLGTFAAENFEHMHVEETENNAVLWASYTDPEIHAIHDRLLASISPVDMAVAIKWMMPAVSHAERVGMMAGMREKAPAPVFDQVLGAIKPMLTEKNWGKLAGALGV